MLYQLGLWNKTPSIRHNTDLEFEPSRLMLIRRTARHACNVVCGQLYTLQAKRAVVIIQFECIYCEHDICIFPADALTHKQNFCSHCLSAA